MRLILAFVFTLFGLPLFGQYYGHVYTPVGSSYDPDFQAVLDEATNLGYTLPSASQQDAMNQFVIDAKASGYWSDLDYFAVHAHDADINFCRINWVDPTSTKATFTAVDHVDDQGCDCSATSGRMDSNWKFADGPNNVNSDVAAGVWADWINSGSTIYYYLGDGTSISTSNFTRYRGSQFGVTVGITNNYNAFLSSAQQSEGLFSVFTSGGITGAKKNNTTLFSTSSYTLLTYNTNDVYFMSAFGASNGCQVGRVYRMVYAGALGSSEIDDLYTDFDNYLTTVGI